MAIYLLKINVALIILYGFYRAMFGQDTFFGWRRAMLIGIYIVALSIPLLDIETLIRSNESVVSMAYAYAEVVLPPVTVSVLMMGRSTTVSNTWLPMVSTRTSSNRPVA